MEKLWKPLDKLEGQIVIWKTINRFTGEREEDEGEGGSSITKSRGGEVRRHTAHDNET